MMSKNYWLRQESFVMTPMDEADFAWLHQALTEAFADVVNPMARQTISGQALDGEIYTRIRAQLASASLRNDSPLRSLFSSRRRWAGFKFDQLKQNDKERVAAMFNGIKQRRLSEGVGADGRLRELEILLAGMRSSVNQMADAAKRSEEVRDKIEELDEFLSTNA